jgi:hypothetical protein
MSWEKMTGFAPLWNPVVHEEIDGIVESVRETEFGNQFQIRLIIPQELTVYNDAGENTVVKMDKASIIATPSHKMLVNILNQTPIGTRVKIKLVDKVPNKNKGKNDMLVYEVAKWKD